MTRKFLKALHEEEDDEELCRPTFRTDKLGNRIAIPFAGTYREGKNGSGVAIPKSHTAREDNLGQMHAIPPGHILRISSTGRGTVVCPTQSTSEKNGQIVVNHQKPKTESRKLACWELVRMTKFLAESGTPWKKF